MILERYGDDGPRNGMIQEHGYRQVGNDPKDSDVEERYRK